MRCLTLIALLSVLSSAATAQQYDLLIRGGRVLDGSGAPWVRADVAITGDRIVAVGRLPDAAARRVIDASGLRVAPGFIDVHSHAGSALSDSTLAGAWPLLAQGITTIVVNPDGGGPVDLTKLRAAIEARHPGVNVAPLIGHGAVRREVLGMEDRAPTAAELARMQTLVRAAMEQGAFGLSSGLYYAPGSYAQTEEVIELAKVAAEYDGVYTSHIRDESDYTVGVVAAVDEVIRIAREAGLPGVVTHIKALGPRVWGASAEIVRRIGQARAQGVEIFADQYPYEASGTSIVGALVPRWALVGGDDALQRRLRDPAARAGVRADMLANLERRGGAARLQFRSYPPDRSIEGRTLADVAAERKLEPVDLALRLLERGDAGLVSFNMSEEDVERFMRQPWTMTSSDGDLVPMGEGVPHPRSYGTFPRKLRGYALERNVIGFEQAIHSMTHLSATVFRLHDRGVIRSGAFADIVVFDLAKLRDTASYGDPHRLAQGMVFVLVNGGVAVDGGLFTDGRYGRVLQKRPPTHQPWQSGSASLERRLFAARQERTHDHTTESGSQASWARPK